MTRLAIALVGFSAAIASGIGAVVLGYLADDLASQWLLWPLVLSAVSGPLYGTLAALRSARWLPLLVGVALAAGALLWLCFLADVPLELPEHLA